MKTIEANQIEKLATVAGVHTLTVDLKTFWEIHDYLFFTLGWSYRDVRNADDSYTTHHFNADGSICIAINVCEDEEINEVANLIKDNANTGNEQTVNDCICFGMGVYAYKKECISAGIPVNSNRAAFHHLNENELITLLTWLKDNDGYLIAA